MSDNVRSAAPPGYRSLTEAILHILRFGFGKWGPAKTAVLLYHVERTAAYGKESDAHSATQAISGVYSRRTGKWTRGPIGVSRSHYHRINSELSEEGLLLRTRVKSVSGDSAPTEFAPAFPRIRAILTTYESSLRPADASPREAEQQRGSSHHGTTPTQSADPWLSHGETTPVLQGDSGSSPLRTHSEVDSASIHFDTSGVKPVELGEVAELRRLIEHLTGCTLKQSDLLPEALLEAADQLHISVRVLVRFLMEKGERKRQSRYGITPGLIKRMVEEDLQRWCIENRRLVGILLEIDARSRATTQFTEAGQIEPGSLGSGPADFSEDSSLEQPGRAKEPVGEESPVATMHTTKDPEMPVIPPCQVCGNFGVVGGFSGPAEWCSCEHANRRREREPNYVASYNATCGRVSVMSVTPPSLSADPGRRITA